MATKLEVTEEIHTQYKSLSQAFAKNKAMILMIDDHSKLIVEKMYPTKDFNYAQLLEELPKDDSRYIIINWSYEKEGIKKEDPICILMCPLQCKPIKKMKYSIAVSSLCTDLGSIVKTFQADSLSDIEESKITASLLGNK